MYDKELLLFQLGPVQEFIAQAEKIGDLWAGSYLLSSIVWAGLQVIPDKEKSMVFPDLSTDAVKIALEEKKIPTIPNRFLSWVPKGQGVAVARSVINACKIKLLEFAQKADLPKGWEPQVERFLQTSWAILPEEEQTGDMGADYKAVGRKLAMRRNVRDFVPWQEVEGLQTATKDFLSGKESALKNKLGAMNLIKRSLSGMREKVNVGIKETYLAVIAMDGDKMGETLSKFKTEDEHRKFSSSLAEFANSVNEIVEKHNGYLIYAGGDDVLAVVPATEAIYCANELREKFSEKVNGLAASAGIAVGHRSVPLQDLVHKAHSAEARAKSNYNRNALAMSVFKRSGEILEWGCKWNSSAFEIYDMMRNFSEKELSNRFPYKLAELLQPYGTLSAKMKDVAVLEFEHAWKRSSSRDMDAEFADAVSKYLDEVFGKNGNPNDFLTLFLCETFINRRREGEV